MLKQYPTWRETVAVVAVLCLYFGYLGQHRLIDYDEGFYLMAAELVAEGKVLYRDFLFNQSPLLPYLFALWMKLTSFSWTSARLLASFLTALLGGLLYFQAFRLTNRRDLALGSVILFGSASLVGGWMTLVKPYSLSTLMMFAAFCLACHKRSTGSLILSGVCFALACDTRIMLAAALPAFLYGFRLGKERLIWLAGFGLGLSPNLILVMLDNTNYWFGNIGLHAIRTSSGLVGNFGQKTEIASRLLAIQSADGSVSFQFLFLMLATLALVFTRPAEEYKLAFRILVCLGLVSLLPTPIFNQYFCTLVPFQIVGVVGLLELCGRGGELGKGLSKALMVGACLYVMAGAVDLAHYCGVSTPWQSYDRSKTEAWDPASVRQISALVNKHSQPGDVAYSSWSGYFLESHVQPLPGTEMDFVRITGLGERVSESDRKRHRLLSKAEILAAVRAGETSIVVNGIQKGEAAEVQAMDAMLRATGYQLVEATNICGIYKRVR